MTKKNFSKQFGALILFIILGFLLLPDAATFMLITFRFSVAVSILMATLIVIGHSKECGLFRVDLEDVMQQGEPGRVFQGICFIIGVLIWVVIR